MDSARWLVAAVVVLAIGLGVAIVAMMRARTAANPATVTIDSPQPGAEVLVDGRRVGVTPLKVAVGTDMRSIRVVSAAAGAATVPPATNGSTEDMCVNYRCALKGGE